jgi:hypothetical protein
VVVHTIHSLAVGIEKLLSDRSSGGGGGGSLTAGLLDGVSPYPFFILPLNRELMEGFRFIFSSCPRQD